MALFAIGDIHGCLTALETLFKQDFIQEQDTVVFLGDYVDRGPNSKGVFDFLLKQQETYHFKFILGNHEIMMRAAKDSPRSLAYWLSFGGLETLASYEIGDDPNWMEQVDETHWTFIDACLPYLEIADFIFVHAGLEKGKSLADQDEDHLFWNKFVSPEKYSDEKTVICGHTSRKNGEIANFGHTICIDTYAYGGQWLTCLNVETKEYVQANEKGAFVRGNL